MKIVDKHALALMPEGTAFYRLDKWGNIGEGCEQGLLIKSSGTFYSFDNEPMFNGVIYLQPDTPEGCGFDFPKDTEVPYDFELFDVDTDSNDFDDDDRFLVLEPKELKKIADFLQECYLDNTEKPIYDPESRLDREVKLDKIDEIEHDFDVDLTEPKVFFTSFSHNGKEYKAILYEDKANDKRKI